MGKGMTDATLRARTVQVKKGRSSSSITHVSPGCVLVVTVTLDRNRYHIDIMMEITKICKSNVRASEAG